jgi:hypothetical protein
LAGAGEQEFARAAENLGPSFDQAERRRIAANANSPAALTSVGERD